MQGLQTAPAPSMTRGVLGIILDFGKDISWFGMDAAQARGLTNGMLSMADAMDEADSDAQTPSTNISAPLLLLQLPQRR
jgi:hypothetical protein